LITDNLKKCIPHTREIMRTETQLSMHNLPPAIPTSSIYTQFLQGSTWSLQPKMVKNARVNGMPLVQKYF